MINKLIAPMKALLAVKADEVVQLEAHAQTAMTELHDEALGHVRRLLLQVLQLQDVWSGVQLTAAASGDDAPLSPVEMADDLSDALGVFANVIVERALDDARERANEYEIGVHIRCADGGVADDDHKALVTEIVRFGSDGELDTLNARLGACARPAIAFWHDKPIFVPVCPIAGDPAHAVAPHEDCS